MGAVEKSIHSRSSHIAKRPLSQIIVSGFFLPRLVAAMVNLVKFCPHMTPVESLLLRACAGNPPFSGRSLGYPFQRCPLPEPHGSWCWWSILRLGLSTFFSSQINSTLPFERLIFIAHRSVVDPIALAPVIG